ncbi:hypothetical protein AX17_002733 [Amanita inopinata Kibby_2008]|nr:hypothetical protein AX17_002733 [Amanita inopinata Kibby_2008]
MALVHLLVLMHGMWGNPSHLSEAHRIISEQYPSPIDDMELQILVAETNRDESTYDGIDWGGERVADEILSKVKQVKDSGKQVKRLSITGYSLGGLIGRYVVGILFQQRFFDDVEPINFNTIATPHIGLPRYPSFISRMFSHLGPKLLSRTGEQFYCADRWSPRGRPLLEVMADPERAFYQGLALFKHIRLYANATNDITVPYVTAAIELEDPFIDHESNGMYIELDPKYDPLIAKYSVPSSPPLGPPVLSREWLWRLKPRAPPLPPFLQRGFPLNILIYMSIPILIPIFVSTAIIHLSLASRSSRARLQLLEGESQGQKLVHILAELESNMEEVTSDLVDDSASDLVDDRTAIPQAPVLSLVQRRMVQSLNELPLKKELALIREVRNSHATIVCRDVKRFDFHRRGEGVLKHWAVSFIL